MALLLTTLSALLFIYASLSRAQYSCLSNGENVASDLPSCDIVKNTYTQCNNLNGDALNNCICTQKLFSSIFNCESEYRQCLDSYEEDNEMQQVLANWHSECDTYISFTPATPVLSTPTSTIAAYAVCTNIESICSLGGSITRDCKESYTANSQSVSLSSCLCQTSLLSAASVCEYDGNITCFQRPATLSSVDLWILCPVQASAFPTSAIDASTSPSLSTSVSSIVPAASSSLFRVSSSSMTSPSSVVASVTTPMTVSSTAPSSKTPPPTSQVSSATTNDGHALGASAEFALAGTLGLLIFAVFVT